MKITKSEKRIKRHIKIRKTLKGDSVKPRAVVFRSNRYMELQIIDDTNAKTIISGTDKTKKGEKSTLKGTKTEKASQLGERIGKKTVESGISSIVFDRGGYKYHGRIKAVAEGLRKGGLKF